jgi:hypothetical protein
MPDDFYVGYLEKAPTGIAKFLKGRVFLLLFVALVAAGVIAVDQGPFRPSVFEFGVEREFVGWLSISPVPSLFAKVPGHHDAEVSSGVCGANYSAYPIAESGTKFGVADVAKEWDGRLVRLRGSLIYLDRETMLDIVPDSVVAIGTESGGATGAVTEELGTLTLSGEIVDSKCHFGVMDPSTGKVHRACAARCISSGIPPALHVEDEEGRIANLLLVGRDGRAVNREIAAYIGEAVRITGRVVRHENLLVLHADPGDIERL